MGLNDDLAAVKNRVIVRKALKYPFLRKGMGIDLPITIAHKEWELNPYVQIFTEFCEKWGLGCFSINYHQNLHKLLLLRVDILQPLFNRHRHRDYYGECNRRKHRV